MSAARRIASLALVLAPAVRAFETDPAVPVVLLADRVEVDHKAVVSRYRGNVRFERGGTRVHAEQAEVRHRAGAIETMEARGAPLRFRHHAEGRPELHGVAERLEYHAAERRISLYGAVRLERGADAIVGEALHYYPANGLLRGGDGAGPVRMQLRLHRSPTAPQAAPAAGPAL
jgi:lipopolysaccharide transport protein LptA